jgi:hypothetical protein
VLEEERAREELKLEVATLKATLEAGAYTRSRFSST